MLARPADGSGGNAFVQLLDRPPRGSWLPLVDMALAEDIGPGDATTLALITPVALGSARLEARQELVVCGLEIAVEVFARLGVEFTSDVADGETVAPLAVLGQARGPAAGILAAERTALNFVQRLTGIATLARRYVDAVRGTRCEIVDTRKTTPGWRALDKYAVRCGGAHNHRMGLFDGVLIKDNHLRAVGSVALAVKRARERGSRHLRIRVEVESLEEAREALEAGADSILIDNQTPSVVRGIVEWVSGRLRTEASGGITLETVAEMARTGVDEISVGALTHSAPAADVALEWNAASTR